jgi:hypothetical protein
MNTRQQKKRLYKRPGQSEKKTSIRLHEQIVSGAVFAVVPDSDQYALLVLGHVFQEISWLQRMLYVARENIASESEIEKDGDAFQLLFLTRLMLGKLKEFDTLLEKEKKIVTFLVANFDPESPARGTAAVEGIQAKFASNTWIRTGRNKHFLHYPIFNDVKTALGYIDSNWDYKVYHSELSTLTLYKTADAFANLAWFNLADSEDPFRGFNSALDALLFIAGDVLALIELALGHQLSGPLAREGDTKQVVMAVRPFSTQRFDFFCALAREK